MGVRLGVKVKVKGRIGVGCTQDSDLGSRFEVRVKIKELGPGWR